MTLNEFTQSALNFAEDSKDWQRLPNAYFTTDNSSKRGYRESSDNYNAGLDLCWAFGLSPEQIQQRAPKEFIEQLQQYLQLVDDEVSCGDNSAFKTAKEVLEFLEAFK